MTARPVLYAWEWPIGDIRHVENEAVPVADRDIRAATGWWLATTSRSFSHWLSETRTTRRTYLRLCAP